MRIGWMATALAASQLLTACATYPTRAGLDETRALVAQRGMPEARAERPLACAADTPEVSAALAQPLDAERAVAVALTCNPALAAEYARLGLARADAFDAARLANPTLAASSLDSNARGASRQWGLGLAQNFTNLLLRGQRKKMAEGEFLRTQQWLAGAVLNLAVEVKTAYYRALAARQLQTLHAADAEAARTSADLAREFQKAGNLSARELAEEDARAMEAGKAARDAANAAAQTLVELRIALGLPIEAAWTWPEAIELPKATEDPHEGLQARAFAQRLDLAAADQLVTLLAAGEQGTRSWRWLGDFELGVDYERESDRSRLLGPSLSIQLPLFDRGQGRVARAVSLREWGEAERRRLRLLVANEVDLACQQVRSAREQVDDYRVHLLPQRARVTAETQLEVNFMLRGPFELIATRREEYAAHAGYLEALRDYWLARVALERATGARLPSDDQAGTDTYSLAPLLAPEPAPMHMHPGAHP